MAYYHYYYSFFQEDDVMFATSCLSPVVCHQFARFASLQPTPDSASWLGFHKWPNNGHDIASHSTHYNFIALTQD